MELKAGLKAALYLVPTPIGNIGDITLRALKILASADIIACEDTRRTGIFLKRYNIEPGRLISCHEQNEIQRSAEIVSEIKNGKSVAFTSDAGTPSVSDPGWRIVNKSIEENIEVIALPGATAFVPALVASGMAVDSFKFWGFPPAKKNRRHFIEEVEKEPSTSVLYESPHRLRKILEELSEQCEPWRKICVAREISKIFEEYIRTDCRRIKDIFNSVQNPKGEFVIILEGKKGRE